MTRTQYQHNLDTLKRYVIEMGDKSYQSVADSMTSLNSLDVGLAEKVIKGDQIIDEYDLMIEKCVSQLIARQSPTAGDMRLVTSCLKMALDLERMSDLAVDIAKITRCIEKKHTKPFPNVLKMAELGKDMLHQSIVAFDTLDEELARRTAAKDDEVDKIFYESQKELIEMMSEDRSMINNASYLLFVIRYLERIGDHACNICESVVYVASGERADLN
ncbi:phosphate signaling complex protein PhoU [Methanolobus halotolerans]|uniref:Phosphate-specific transport system accessory protein PhoU n=1 Tax=Methanolobus halotolerans TaxID=2052935 RepID=A0A4E0Q7C3_9EURY|nr:phosphate signaling complex protein PhoU [Methanolobus halotolerans]TGC06781.1 phosphate transport system regulatory protein PhoU [Methanolobus halotolerans]